MHYQLCVCSQFIHRRSMIQGYQDIRSQRHIVLRLSNSTLRTQISKPLVPLYFLKNKEERHSL